MTKQEAMRLTESQLKERLNFYTSNKIWAGDYFTLDTEMQRRRTAEWVHEDVFGEPYKWDVDLQKFVVPQSGQQYSSR